MNKEFEKFSEGIKKIKAEGFVPASQMLQESVVASKDNMMQKLAGMADRWKTIDKGADIAKMGRKPSDYITEAPAIAQQPLRPQPQPVPQPKKNSDWDIPLGVMTEGFINHSDSPMDDPEDAIFQKNLAAKFAMARERAQHQQIQQPPQQAHYQPPQPQVQPVQQMQYPQQINEGYVQMQQPVYYQPAPQVQLINEAMIVDLATKAVKKVMSEQYGEEFIKKVVLQTILTLKESSKKG